MPVPVSLISACSPPANANVVSHGRRRCPSAAWSRSRGSATTPDTAGTSQVTRYWQRYRLGPGHQLPRLPAHRRGRARPAGALEGFSLAPRRRRRSGTPRPSRAHRASSTADRFVEYLTARLTQRSAGRAQGRGLAPRLLCPRRARPDRGPCGLPALIRSVTALEQALGLSSRARRASTSSARPWSRPCSMACSPPGCCGARSSRRAPPHASTGGWPTGTLHVPMLRAALRADRHAHQLAPARSGRGHATGRPLP